MINENLEVRLNSLGSTEFESLVKDIIDREYGSFFEYVPNHIGKVLGKNCPKNGTPDIAFMFKNDQGRRFTYFVEITTEKNSIAAPKGKIERDLTKCEEVITSENINVDRVIYACTSKISVKQNERFCKRCEDFNSEFIFWGIDAIISKLNKYEDLAVKHLQVTLATGNIKPLDAYLSEKKSGVTEENPFMYREADQEEIIAYLAKSRVVLLSGPSGCGKTRLAIEVAKQFSKEEGCKAYWTQDCSFSITGDIAGYAAKNKKSIIIIDDVNRKPSAIDALNFAAQYKNVYIILTVRDYALEDFKDKAKDVSICYLILSQLKHSEIKKIVSNGFGITNVKYLNYIIDVAKGNLRFAIMTAEVLVKQNCTMSSVAEVLEIYYKGIAKSIGLNANSELANTLVALAVFKTIDIRDDRLIKQICEVFKISFNHFTTNLDYLNEKELIKYFYSKNRVQIADQVLADYLCYKLIVELKTVKMIDIFYAFFQYYRQQCLDMVKSLVNIYIDDDKLLSSIKSLKEVFKKADNIVEYYWIFAGLFPTEAIDYCYLSLSNYEGQVSYSSAYFNTWSKMIVLLESQYENDEKVIDYLLMLFKAKKNLRDAILSSFNNNLDIGLQSYKNKFKSQIILLTKCLKLVKSDVEYLDVLYALVKLYFPFEHECSEMKYDRDAQQDVMNIHRFQLPVCRETEELRKLVWSAVQILYDNGYEDKLSELIDSNAYGEVDNNVLEMDKPFALEMFNYINKSSLAGKIFCCKLLLAYRKFDGFVDYYNKLSTSLDFILYKKYICQIIGKRVFEEGTINEILDDLANYRKDEIEESIISLFLTCDSKEIWAVRELTPYAFNVLYERDKDGYDQCVINFISKAGDVSCQPIDILKNVLDKVYLLSWLDNCNLVSKYTWIAQLYLVFKSYEVTNKIADKAFDFFAHKYERCVWGNEQLLNLKEFEEVKPGFCHDLLEIYLSKDKADSRFINRLFYDLDLLLNLLRHDIELITKAYFFVLRQEGHTDYEGKIANYLIKEDPSNLLKLIKLKFSTNNSYIKLSNFYNVPNFIDKFIECIRDMPYINYNLMALKEIENFSSEMYGQFIKVISAKYIMDKNFLLTISSIICYCDTNRQILFLDELLKANVNCDLLNKLHVLGYPSSWSGSIVPHFQKNIEALSNYINNYRQSPKYLPFLHQRLDRLKEMIVCEEAQEYNTRI